MNDDFSIAKGWIKAHRYWLDDPIILKNADHFAMWTYLNLLATHQARQVEFNGKRHLLNPGELITGRKSISRKLKMDESKVQRILKRFTNEGLIRQRTTNKNRLISIISWYDDQISEHQNGQQKIPGLVMKKEVLDDSTNPDKQPDRQQNRRVRTTIEQQSNTNKNYKNINNVEEVVIKDDNPLQLQITELFSSSWGREAKPGEIRLCSKLIKEVGVTIVKDAFDEAITTSSDKDSVKYVKAICERVYNENQEKIYLVKRMEAKKNNDHPSLEEVKAFFNEIKSNEEKAVKFFNHYAAESWAIRCGLKRKYIGYKDDWKYHAETWAFPNSSLSNSKYREHERKLDRLLGLNAEK